MIDDLGLIDEGVGVSAAAAELQDLNVEVNRGLTLRALLGIEGDGDKRNASVAVCQLVALQTGGVAADTAVRHGFGLGVDDGSVALCSAENEIIGNVVGIVLVIDLIDAVGRII